MATDVLKALHPPSDFWRCPLSAAGEEGSWWPSMGTVPSPPAWQVAALLAGVLWLLASRACRVVPRFRQWLQPIVKRHVAAGAQTILAVQKFQHPVLDAIFSAGAWVVSIEFYTAFLPLFFWTGNVQLGCNLTILMALCIWVGNSIKDIVCAPRPPCPPVRRLTATEGEREGSLEFGLPSSHTINTICLSLYILADVNEKGLTRAWGPLHAHALSATVLVFVAAIVFGRLYLGMHSAIDVAAGAVIGALVPLLWRLVEGAVYDFVLRDRNLEAFMMALVVLLLFAYPAPESATPSYEHHTAFTGVVFGVVVGIHRVEHLYYLPGAAALSTALPQGAVALARRCAVGFVLCLVTKAAAKSAAVRVLPPLCAAAGIPFHSTSYLRAKEVVLVADASPASGKSSGLAKGGISLSEALILAPAACGQGGGDGPDGSHAEGNGPLPCDAVKAGLSCDSCRSNAGPLLGSPAGGLERTMADVQGYLGEVESPTVSPSGSADGGLLCCSHEGSAKQSLVRRPSRVGMQLPAGKGQGLFSVEPELLSNKVTERYMEHTVEKGPVQQCCYWLLNVASVDIDTGIRFVSYAGLAWAVVEPAAYVFGLLNI